MPDLTAIIPSRDRPDLLRDCLRTLAGQRLEGVGLEVLVVDDGSASPLAPLVEGLSAPGVAFRCLVLPPTGAAGARNAGVLEAASPLVAFLDDDVYVDPGWARETVRAFEVTRCDGVGGRILLHYEAPRPWWLRDDEHGYLSGFDRGAEPRALTADELPFSANCAVTREAFDRLGGFRSDVDRVGDPLIAGGRLGQEGGETDLYRRLLGDGGTVVYWPGASVRHRIPAERLRWRYFLRRAFSQALSDEHLEGRPRSRAELIHRLARLAGWTARWPATAAWSLIRRGDVLGPGVWGVYCAGRWIALRRWGRGGPLAG